MEKVWSVNITAGSLQELQEKVVLLAKDCGFSVKRGEQLELPLASGSGPGAQTAKTPSEPPKRGRPTKKVTLSAEEGAKAAAEDGVGVEEKSHHTISDIKQASDPFEAAPAAAGLTKEKIGEIARDFSSKKGIPALKDVLQKLGAAKMSELKEADYQKFSQLALSA